MVQQMTARCLTHWPGLLCVTVFVLTVLVGAGSPPAAQAQAPDPAYQEALDRIREAQETGATELDLSGIGLSELPPEIGQLTNLQTLDLSDNSLTKLPPEIGQLAQLQTLWLFDNPLESPPPDVVAHGTEAVLTYLREQLAANFSGGNDDWTPIVQAFDGVEMVLVPAGCFEMGTPGKLWASPVHTVCFEEPFWIDRYEVTNGQFATFEGVAAGESRWTGAERPREQITWYEARDFCASRGVRLPTEAEWEYAARGPDALEFPWGDKWDQSLVVGDRGTDDGTAPVGSIPGGASWVGALDMSGNVWEWVADWSGDDYFETLPDGVVNPQGPETGAARVLRGGAWANWGIDFYRAAFRNGGTPDSSRFSDGFRCARSRGSHHSAGDE